MSVNSPISPCRLTRGSYTSYFTLQILLEMHYDIDTARRRLWFTVSRYHIYRGFRSNLEQTLLRDPYRKHRAQLRQSLNVRSFMTTFSKEVGSFGNFSNTHLRASTSLRNCDLMSLTACRSTVDASTWGGATPEAIFFSHDLKGPSRVRSQILVEMLGRDLKQLD